MANRSSQSICNNWVLNPKSQFLQLNSGKYPIVVANPNGDKKLRMDLGYGVDRYESLILVAGGIGITPFIAIL
jgi:predicted ferric reductase